MHVYKSRVHCCFTRNVLQMHTGATKLQLKKQLPYNLPTTQRTLTVIHFYKRNTPRTIICTYMYNDDIIGKYMSGVHLGGWVGRGIPPPEIMYTCIK